MARVVLLCGKVASGKTHYASKLRSETGAIILSCDELVLKLFDSCLGEKHDQTIARCTDYLFSLATQLHDSGVDCVLDFGFWKKAERVRALKYFADRGILSELIYIRTSEELRLKRLEKRNLQNMQVQTRTYIIKEELRIYLDSKFEEPSEGEAYTLYEN